MPVLDANEIMFTQYEPKVPNRFIIGEKEVSENKVAVRRQGKGDLGQYAISEIFTTLTWKYIETGKQDGERETGRTREGAASRRRTGAGAKQRNEKEDLRATKVKSI